MRNFQDTDVEQVINQSDERERPGERTVASGNSDMHVQFISRRAFFAGVLTFLAFLVIIACSTGSSSRSTQKYSWQVTTGAPAEDLHKMNSAVVNVMDNQSLPPLPSGEEIRFDGVNVTGDWAITGPDIVNSHTGQTAQGESFLILLHKENNTWHAAAQGTSQFNVWLEQVPNSLIGSDEKQLLR